MWLLSHSFNDGFFARKASRGTDTTPRVIRNHILHHYLLWSIMMTLKIDKKLNKFECSPKRDLLFVTRMPTWKASNCVFHTNQREYGRFFQRRKHSKPQTCGQSEVLTLSFKFPTFIFRCYPSLDRKCSPLPFMSNVTHIHQMRSISFIFCHILQAAIRLVFD